MDNVSTSIDFDAPDPRPILHLRSFRQVATSLAADDRLDAIQVARFLHDSATARGRSETREQCLAWAQAQRS